MDASLTNLFQKIPDTLFTVSDSTVVFKTFFGVSGVKPHPELLMHTSHEWLLLLLLFMTAVVAVLNFFIPKKIANHAIGFFSFKNIGRKHTKGLTFSLGIAFQILFFLNFLIMITVLFFLVIQNFMPILFVCCSKEKLFGSILFILLGYVLATRLLLWVINRMLGLMEMELLHIQIDNHAEFIAGLLLLPLLLLYLYTSSYFWLMLAFGLLVVLLVFKWVRIFIFGRKVIHIPPFHLFLYLCTLEMVPILVAIKLFGFDAYL